jgi:hypothetical protein
MRIDGAACRFLRRLKRPLRQDGDRDHEVAIRPKPTRSHCYSIPDRTGYTIGHDRSAPVRARCLLLRSR